MAQSWRIGVDTGGTFTDGILWNERDGRIITAKLLSTPSDPGRAVLAMVDRLFASVSPGAAQALSYLAHGTTVATNAVLQHQLAPCALITTAGFRDMLEIARQVREDAFDVFFEKPPPLVPRHLCFEVVERMDAAFHATVRASDGVLGVGVSTTPDGSLEPTAMDESLIGAFAQAAAEAGASHMRMPSGAEHEAMILARRIPITTACFLTLRFLSVQTILRSTPAILGSALVLPPFALFRFLPSPSSGACKVNM